jgi:hypothetical protein
VRRVVLRLCFAIAIVVAEAQYFDPTTEPARAFADFLIGLFAGDAELLLEGRDKLFALLGNDLFGEPDPSFAHGVL